MHILVHLVDEEQHGYIELNTQPFAEIGYPVEEVGILATEVNGHDIPVRLNTLRYERLFPGQVTYLPICLSGAKSRREHQHVAVALETCVDHGWEIAAL